MLISVTLQFQCGKTCFPVDFPFPNSKFPRKHPFFEVPFELILNPTTNDSRGDYSRVTCMHGIIFAVLFSCFALFEHFVQFHQVPWQIYAVQELTADVKERTWSYPCRAGPGIEQILGVRCTLCLLSYSFYECYTWYSNVAFCSGREGAVFCGGQTTSNQNGLGCWTPLSHRLGCLLLTLIIWNNVVRDQLCCISFWWRRFCSVQAFTTVRAMECSQLTP